MTVSTTTNRISYVGNAVTTVFAYNFLVYDLAHLEVSLDGVVQGSGFTVDGLGNGTGGNGTFAVAPANGVIIVLLRTVPLPQEIDSMMIMPNSDHVLVQPKSRIGRIMKKNEDKISESGRLEYLSAEVPMYAVSKDKAMKVLEMYNTNVISQLPKTDFSKHNATLTRFDRSVKEAAQKEFADATDAPGMTKSSLATAHSTKPAVYVTVRYHIIDPAKFSDN